MVRAAFREASILTSFIYINMDFRYKGQALLASVYFGDLVVLEIDPRAHTSGPFYLSQNSTF